MKFNEQIVFPGVREYTFHKLLCYLYTDEVPAISSARCLNLLELANRLCLQRLVNLVESRVIEDLERLSQNEGNEAVENCLRLLEPCKVSSHQNDLMHDRRIQLPCKVAYSPNLHVYSCTTQIN